MSGLLSPEIASRLVGVIDLLRGRAVHAIAGQRHRYQAVEFCSGDALALAHHYRGLALESLYIADLDAISGAPLQTTLIDAIAHAIDDGGKLLVDPGFSGGEEEPRLESIANLSKRHRQIVWIAATESCASPDTLGELAAIVSPPRVYLGLDYRDGQLLGGRDESAWVDRAFEIGIGGAVLLDLANVGTAAGVATVEACRRVNQRAPDWAVYSGGGIRTADDARSLLAAGCEGCLVATALHRS